MSTIEATSLAVSIGDLIAGSDQATIVEALQIVVYARSLPGALITRAHVAQAAAEELGREPGAVPALLVQAIWDELKPVTMELTHANAEHVKEVVCKVILEMSVNA